MLLPWKSYTNQYFADIERWLIISGIPKGEFQGTTWLLGLVTYLRMSVKCLRLFEESRVL